MFSVPKHRINRSTYIRNFIFRELIYIYIIIKPIKYLWILI